MSITLEQVRKAYDYATEHPDKYLRGTSNWCAAVAHSLNGEQPAPAIKLHLNVSSVEVTVNADGSYTIDPATAPITDEQILEAMRPAITGADGGYVFDTAKADVISAGRALLDAAAVPVAVVMPDFEPAFEAWWESDGQYCRAGGGSYEKTFAYCAYESALAEVARLNGVKP